MGPKIIAFLCVKLSLSGPNIPNSLVDEIDEPAHQSTCDQYSVSMKDDELKLVCVERISQNIKKISQNM